MHNSDASKEIPESNIQDIFASRIFCCDTRTCLYLLFGAYHINHLSYMFESNMTEHEQLLNICQSTDMQTFTLLFLF